LPIIAAGNEVLIGFFALLGVIAGVLGTAWGVKRAKSGKIATTEATELWQESKTMRAELRAEVAALKEEMSTMRIKMAALEAENVQLHRDNADLKRRVVELETAHG
jgi:septal ring factor EnvC (AmiA/AmiB activator)